MPSAYAERSLRAANVLLPLATSRQEWSWRVWRRVTVRAERLQLELALPRAIAAAEDFLLMSATERLHPGLLRPVAPPKGPDRVQSRLRKAAKQFPELRRVWLNDLGVDLATLAEWKTFERWRELRHVIVHRLGYWQPALDEKPLLRDRIERLGENPDLYRGAVPLVSDDLLGAIDTAKSIVLEADGRVEAVLGSAPRPRPRRARAGAAHLPEFPRVSR